LYVTTYLPFPLNAANKACPYDNFPYSDDWYKEDGYEFQRAMRDLDAARNAALDPWCVRTPEGVNLGVTPSGRVWTGVHYAFKRRSDHSRLPEQAKCDVIIGAIHNLVAYFRAHPDWRLPDYPPSPPRPPPALPREMPDIAPLRV
jgi:hypothetical protein